MHFSKVSIEIGKWKVTHVNSLDFSGSDKELLSTCKITLPFIRNARGKIKRGDRVRIDLSMSTDFNQDNFITEFVGKVKKVVLGVPLVVECENNAFLLKQKNISGFYRGIGLKALCEKVLNGLSDSFNIEYTDTIPKITLDKFLIKKGATVYDALLKLSDKFKLTAYFKGDSLFLGSRYVTEKKPKLITYHLEKNVAQDSIVLKSEDDIKIKVKATSRLRSGQELKVEVGDSDGSIKTFFYHNIKTVEYLKELALKELEEAKNKKRNSGTIKVMGLPYIEHSYQVKILSDKEESQDKLGVYFVEKVDVSFGVDNGFKRVIHLGKKLS